MSLIAAAMKDDALLADIEAARRDTAGDALHLWWLGQSGFLVQHAGKHLLFDPYLSDSLTDKYANTDKPHVRMTERVIDPARLDFIDIVTSSHNHTDHLDAATLLPLLAANPGMTVVIPAANRDFVSNRLQVSPDRLSIIEADNSIRVGDVVIHAVPAAHETIERDAHGRCTHLGYVAKVGPWSIYHSGDTVLYDGMAERLKPLDINIALLPINGRGPERRVAGNLWGREAAQLANDIGAGVVIPCHYDMFTFNTAKPEEFVTTCEKLGQRYVVMRSGERWTLRL